MKKKVKVAFIVLCYRETSDLINLINNLYGFKKDISIVVVNSFYDEESKKKFEDISQKYGCDFLNVENKGYGFGNNRGVEFVNKNYDYEFICICNPDIVFNKFPIEELTNEYFSSVIAPEIRTKKGKKQNPYYYFHLSIVDWLKYVGLVRKVKIAYFFGVAINKFIRIVLDSLNNKKSMLIYACHGSCFFIGKDALKKIETPYNEKMFLFHEEEHLARLLKRNNIPVYFQKI